MERVFLTVDGERANPRVGWEHRRHGHPPIRIGIEDEETIARQLRMNREGKREVKSLWILCIGGEPRAAERLRQRKWEAVIQLAPRLSPVARGEHAVSIDRGIRGTGIDGTDDERLDVLDASRRRSWQTAVDRRPAVPSVIAPEDAVRCGRDVDGRRCAGSNRDRKRNVGARRGVRKLRPRSPPSSVFQRPPSRPTIT